MKYNLVVPLAGAGSRMGSQLPKPLILAGNKTIIEWSMDSIDLSECNVYFVIRSEHAYNFSLNTFLEQKFPECTVVQLPDPTRGAVETCLNAMPLLDNNPLIIFCPDVYFNPVFKPQPKHFIEDGFILTFKANSPEYSYVLHEDGYITETKEKVVISQDAAVGVYCFRNKDVFIGSTKAIEHLQEELYICPLYNYLDGGTTHEEVQSIHIMGTAKELNFFESIVYPYLNGPRSFVLCADHSGYDMKEVFKKKLLDLNYPVIDVGCFSTRDCDYFDFLNLAQRSIDQTPGIYGLGFCRSGQGMNISANKVPHLRSALISDSATADLAIRHNAANFFAVSSHAQDVDNIIDKFITSRFEGGRHQNRLQKVMSNG